MDILDERILLHLVRNARATFAEIGAEVKLSAPAVKRRVDRMMADSTIAGFTTIVDPAALGWGTEAYVQVYCKGTVSPQALRATWEPIPEVVSASTVTGQADADPAGPGPRRPAPGAGPGEDPRRRDHRPHRVDHRAVPADRARLARV